MDIIKRKNGQMEMDLAAVFRLMLRKAWLLAIAAIIGGVIAVAYAYLFVEPTYRTGVPLYISNTAEEAQTSIVTTSDLSASMMLMRTCATVIKEEETLVKALELSGLKYDPEILQEMVQVEEIENTKIMYIIATATNPQEAALIADSIAEVTPGIMKAIEPAGSVRILSQAKVPTKKAGPSYSKTALMGFVAGVLLAAILLLIWAIMDTGIKKTRQLEALGLPVLGVLPEEPDRINANLIYSLPGNKSKSILFIGFPPASDKPFTAIELAEAMAGNGNRILLLDANLRTPCLSKALEIDNGPGVSDILVGKADAAATVHSYKKNMDLITSGSPSLNPESLLASEEMGEMLDVLSPGYDYVLILSSSDKWDSGVAGLAGRVSGTVIVVKRKRTKADALQDYLASLKTSGVHVLGALFDTRK